MGIEGKGYFSLRPARCERMGYNHGMLMADIDLEECVKEFVGKFQFGEVYRATYQGEDVIVKIWKKQDMYDVLPGENEGRLQDERLLHSYFKSYEFHPNVVKLFSVCNGPKNFAAIYFLKRKAIDTLHNLIEQDSFTWAQRIKVAFGFASLLRYMHTPHPNCPSYVPYLIRNIDAAHILVDQDHEALLFDFSMISGGILTDKRELVNQRIHGCDGYSDPIFARPGKWSDRCDVFSYGVVLLSLISKRVYNGDGDSYVYKWAKDEHKKQNSVASGNLESLLVHDSLKAEPDFNFKDAYIITKLALKCVRNNPQKRPTMNQVVREMQDLHIVKKNVNTWECCQMLDGVNEIPKPAEKNDREKEYLHRLKWHWGLPYNNRMRRMKGLDNFSWPQRMKVIYELASLLMHLHTPNLPHVPYRVGNIDAAHIILDKEYTPKLLDFGMTVGGIILSSRRTKRNYAGQAYGYIDPDKDHFYEARDIFAFGCIIMCLIYKRVPTSEDELEDDNDNFAPIQFSPDYFCSVNHWRSKDPEKIVHKSLKEESSFDKNDGDEITELGIDCIGYGYNRPSMEDVVKRLKKLNVIKKMGIHLQKKTGKMGNR